MKKIIDEVKNTMVEKLDLPREIIMDSYKLVVEGDGFLTIENHKGVITFKEDEVVLKVRGGTVTLLGKNFEILYISGKTIKLGGVFKGVNYGQE